MVCFSALSVRFHVEYYLVGDDLAYIQGHIELFGKNTGGEGRRLTTGRHGNSTCSDRDGKGMRGERCEVSL